MRYRRGPRAPGRVGQMHDRDERLSRFRRELLVAAARVRQELQPGRSLNARHASQSRKQSSTGTDTVDTIDDKQIAELCRRLRHR